MGTISLTIPVAGSTPFSTAAANVDTDLTTIQTLVNGNIDGANVIAGLTGRRLAASSFMLVGGSVVAMTAVSDAAGAVVVSGNNVNGRPVNWAYLDPAGFAVTGKSNTQLVLRMSLATNATAPAINFTGQLNAVAFSGASASLITPTVGTTVTGSTVAINTPSASSAAVAETAPFTFPAAGAYALTVVTSGTTAANSGTSLTLQLFALNS